MPSMHNAIALLLVFGAWQFSRWAGIVMLVHTFLIYIGSFYLAWHYAIDAYLGWAITLAFWWISGPIAKWWHRQPLVSDFSMRLKS